jgi:hypothetical protein
VWGQERTLLKDFDFKMPTRNHRAYEHLSKQPWARRLLTEIDQRGGVSNRTNEGDLFTMRFGWEMSLACPTGNAIYEFAAGVENSTVDFRLVTGGRIWLFECVAINESVTTQRMWEDSKEELVPGIFASCASFSGRSESIRERPEAELHRVSQSMRQHIWQSENRRYRKFPERTNASANVLVVSMAGLEGIGDPDPYQCREIAFGSATVPVEYRSADLPGLFNQSNNEPGAVAMRERVDLLVFIDDVHGIYDDTSIRRGSKVAVNPSSDAWVKAEYPLRIDGQQMKLNDP